MYNTLLFLFTATEKEAQFFLSGLRNPTLFPSRRTLFLPVLAFSRVGQKFQVLEKRNSLGKNQVRVDILSLPLEQRIKSAMSLCLQRLNYYHAMKIAFDFYVVVRITILKNQKFLSLYP